jgi:hypothetical protein
MRSSIELSPEQLTSRAQLILDDFAAEDVTIYEALAILGAALGELLSEVKRRDPGRLAVCQKAIIAEVLRP